jgi:hypothetical protein
MAGFNFADRKDIERVLQMIRSPSPLPNFGTEGVEYITDGFLLQTPASGIPARSGTTAGKAACTPYFIDSQNGDTLTELTDNDDNPQSYDVYNVSASAVAGSAYILAKRVYGVLIVDMEDCG